MSYLGFLRSLLEEAGMLALSFPSRMSAQVKGADSNQVVTQADLAVGDRIRQRIRQEYPADGILDEEAGAAPGTSSVTWIVDPIDGTANFAAGSPHYGIMVGVLERGEPVAGGVVLPALSDTYLAAAGCGSYLNGTRLKVVSDSDLSQELVAYGMDIHPAEVELDCRLLSGISTHCRGLRMSNSIFDCMMVAKGVYGAFMHRRNRIWDCVAGQVIVQEAGGVFSAMDGRAIDYAEPLTRTGDNFSILACAPSFHETLTAVGAEELARWRAAKHSGRT
jgi:myo-inositol-1(or 4)-monophosphatase